MAIAARRKHPGKDEAGRSHRPAAKKHSVEEPFFAIT